MTQQSHISIISGTLNAYFPFEMKVDKSARRVNAMCQKVRDYQIHVTRNLGNPRTDLMDKLDYRSQIETALSVGQALMGQDLDDQIAPYATSHIAQAFRQSREDNLFVKEACVIISKFNVVCSGVNDNNNPINGTLFYFNNKYE